MTEHPTPDSDSSATVDATEAAPAFNADIPHATPERPLNAVARQALLEAAERRAVADALAQTPTEHGGPSGPEPTRYGDWEMKGLAIDF